MKRGVAALTLSIATACAAGARAPAPREPPRVDPRAAFDAGADAAPDPSAGVASLDAILARGASEVAQMHDVLRIEDLGARAAELGPFASDVCLRAIVAANVAMTARFEDAAHGSRGDSIQGGAGPGLVPPRGPVCARKGERLRLVVVPADGGTLFARAVVWQAP